MSTRIGQGSQVVDVLHYVQTWLPLSAGFVHALVDGSRHGAVVVARDPLVNVATFPHAPLTRATGKVALATQIVMRRADLVHAHFGYAAGDIVGVARRTRRPFVVSLHGNDATARTPSHYERIAPASAAVIVPSRFLADHAERLGFDASKVHVIPAGVDTAFFTPTPLPDGPPIAVFVGRLVEKKGVDVLLEAWSVVRRAVPDARLVVLGDGPLAPIVGGDGVRHELPDPALRHRQVLDLIRSSTVVVQPSRTGADGDAESLLLVNLEAQASGRALVTTQHGGIPEFVDDTSTVLVPENDAAALAGALVEVLRDRALASRLGSAGPDVAARFDVRSCTARVDDLYERLV
jgi:colanic acid/amylovoran biosynthesis glycosyltransferase